jgi:hypothetical protein
MGGGRTNTQGALLRHELNVENHLKPGCGFQPTTWSRRTSAEAFVLEQLFCYGLWGRVTTNVLEWSIHFSNYAAIEEFLNGQPLPPWKWARFGCFKPVHMPCASEDLSPPDRDITRGAPELETSLAADRYLKPLRPLFEKFRGRWSTDLVRPTQHYLLHLPMPEKLEST